jgi:hypothetical protein
MAKSPTKLSIRAYHVGFGDCFLLSFAYDEGEKHVLIDFGSTGLPKGTTRSRMMDIARNIKERSRDKLTAVVATHRHKDHISGFETKARGKGTGDVIRALRPELVIQPWTEDPKLAPDAAGPVEQKVGAGGARSFIAGLRSMQDVAGQVMQQSRQTRYFAPSLKQQFYFLGESNIANPSAVENLRTMGKRTNYVYYGKDSGLGSLLPGVTVEVLGPPTVKQTAAIKKQRSRDPDEFWHFWRFQAAALEMATLGKEPLALFPGHVQARGPRFPVDARWFIHHVRRSRGDQLLQIVRMLDKAMNNTSVILLVRVGEKSFLFPGDAQIENWQYALSREADRKRLANVNLYKVGHHGSLNATPKSLWGLFKNRSRNPTHANRLKSLMSTMEDKHGSEASHTEVPRTTLVSTLKTQSDLFSTQSLSRNDFFHDTSFDL